jgi:hypothetical protein
MIERLIDEASDFYGLGDGAFFSVQRGYVTRAREAVARVAADRMGWSLRRIARHFKKDIRAIREGDVRSKERLRDDPIFFELVSRLERIVSPYDNPGL